MKKSINKVIPLYFSQALSALLPLLLSPLIIKKEGLDVFGLYSGLITISQFAMIISEYSFDYIGPKKINGINDDKIYKDVLSSKIILLILSCFVIIPIAVVVLNKSLTIIDVFMLVFVMLGQAILAPWYHLSRGDTFILSINVCLSRLICLILSIAYILTIENISYTILFSMYAFPIFFCALLFNHKNIFSNPSYNLKEALSLIKEGRGLFYANIAASGQNIIAPLSIGFIGTPSMLGVYNAIDRLARFLSATIKPILQYSYSRNVKAFQLSIENGNKNIMRLAVFFIFLSFFALLISFLYGREILEILYDIEVSNYKNILIILIGWISIGLLNNAFGIQALLPLGYDRQYTKAIWLSFIVTLSSIGFMSLFIDILYACAISILVGEILAFIFIFSNYRKIYINEN